MRYPKTKSLYPLLLSALASTASAVNLGNDGTGQVLIFPYYTTRTAGIGDWATYLNVVNHTPDTKALRLRFREGKNGRSVFDMNLYLGAGDVWSGAVSRTGEGAHLTSADQSCVSSAGSLATSVAADAVPTTFSNAAYVGVSTTQGISDGYDGEDSSLDRTREGFFEIIEMGVITSTAIINGLKHNSSGIPANCGVVANITGSVIDAPRGGISGGASLIHVMKGADFGYEPVVLEDFYRPAKAGDNLWAAPGNVLPDLSQATPVSRMLYLHNATTADNPSGLVTDVLETNWNNGIDAVSAVLTHEFVQNAYVLDSSTQSRTDWIITFPTKHHYISAKAPGTSTPNDPNGTQRRAPFSNYFWTGGACDNAFIAAWGRDEQSFPYGFDHSGGRIDVTVAEHCWASNIATIHNKSTLLADGTLLNSKNFVKSVSYQGSSRVSSTNSIPVMYWVENGWARLEFGVFFSLNGFNPIFLVAPSQFSRSEESYYGLPVVGFMVQDFVNTNVSIGGLPSTSSYGGNFNHKYTRFINGGNVRP